MTPTTDNGIGSALRVLAGALLGWLVAKGWVTTDNAAILLPAVVAVGTSVWIWWSTKQRKEEKIEVHNVGVAKGAIAQAEATNTTVVPEAITEVMETKSLNNNQLSK